MADNGVVRYFLLFLCCFIVIPTGAIAKTVGNISQLPVSFEKNLGQAEKGTFYQARTAHYLAKIEDNGFRITPRTVSGTPLHFRFLGAEGTAPPEGVSPLKGRVNYIRGNNPASWKSNIPLFERVVDKSVFPGVDLVYRFNPKQELEYDLVVNGDQPVERVTLEISGAQGLSIGKDGQLVIDTPQGQLIQKTPFVYQQQQDRRLGVSARYEVLNEQQVALHIGDYDTNQELTIDPVLSFSTYLGGSSSDLIHDVAYDSNDETVVVTGGTATVVYITPDSVLESAPQGSFPATPGTAQDTAGEEGSSCSYEYDAVKGRGYTEERLVYDAFVAKLDPSDGSLIYATYFGGCEGEQGRGIFVDGSSNAYIVGTTRSADMPLAFPVPAINGGKNEDNSDAFVAKFDSAGLLLASRFVGGEGDDFGRGIKVDYRGYMYIVGHTQSPDMPFAPTCDETTIGGDGCYSGLTDAFFARVHSGFLTVGAGRYIGGYRGDWASNLEIIDESTLEGVEIYIAGVTASPDFPLSTEPYKEYIEGESCSRSNSEFVADERDCQDAYFMMLKGFGSDEATRNGQLVFSSALGGERDDMALDIAVDDNKYVYVVGTTASAGVILDRVIGDPGNPSNPDDVEIYNRFPLYKQILDANEQEMEFKDTGSQEAFLGVFEGNDKGVNVRYLGFLRGSDADRATSVLVTTEINDVTSVSEKVIYVVGQTRSKDFFPLNNAFKTHAESEDVFITKLRETTVTIDSVPKKRLKTEYSTLFGGEELDFPKAVALTNIAGNRGIVVVGGTNSNELPTVSPQGSPFQTNLASLNADGFIMHIDESVDTDADLQLTMSSTPQKINAEETLNFSVDVNNLSATASNDVRLIIEVSSPITLKYAPNCSLEDRVFYCKLGDLGALDSGTDAQTLDFSLAPKYGGNLRFRAYVYSQVVDSIIDNNSITRIVAVEGETSTSSLALNPWLFMLFLPLLSIFRRVIKPS